VRRACLTHHGIKQKKNTNCEEPGSNHESSANALEAVEKNTQTHT
jgi:hypothetical protein